MSALKELIENYAVDVEFPDVSGFELLEMLDLRSEIAEGKGELTEEERQLLEEADRRFLQRAYSFYASISQVADLTEARRLGNVPPSQWWWYLDTLVEATKIAA